MVRIKKCYIRGGFYYTHTGTDIKYLLIVIISCSSSWDFLLLCCRPYYCSAGNYSSFPSSSFFTGKYISYSFYSSCKDISKSSSSTISSLLSLDYSSSILPTWKILVTISSLVPLSSSSVPVPVQSSTHPTLFMLPHPYLHCY